jgi:hypothetical protein
LIAGDIVTAAEDPDLLIIDNCLMVGAWSPPGIPGDLGPGTAIFAIPDIVFQAPLVTEVVVFRAAEEPRPRETPPRSGDPSDHAA